jgi:hypothetical protein
MPDGTGKRETLWGGVSSSYSAEMISAYSAFIT